MAEQEVIILKGTTRLFSLHLASSAAGDAVFLLKDGGELLQLGASRLAGDQDSFARRAGKDVAGLVNAAIAGLGAAARHGAQQIELLADQAALFDFMRNRQGRADADLAPLERLLEPYRWVSLRKVGAQHNAEAHGFCQLVAKPGAAKAENSGEQTSASQSAEPASGKAAGKSAKPATPKPTPKSAPAEQTTGVGVEGATARPAAPAVTRPNLRVVGGAEAAVPELPTGTGRGTMETHVAQFYLNGDLVLARQLLSQKIPLTDAMKRLARPVERKHLRALQLRYLNATDDMLLDPTSWEREALVEAFAGRYTAGDRARAERVLAGTADLSGAETLDNGVSVVKRLINGWQSVYARYVETPPQATGSAAVETVPSPAADAAPVAEPAPRFPPFTLAQMNPGWHAVYSDGSGKGGYGYLLRNRKKQIDTGYGALDYEHEAIAAESCVSLAAELVGAFKGIEDALSRGYRNLHVVTDCQTIIGVIDGTGHPTHPSIQLMQERFARLRAAFDGFLVHWTPRQYNQVADKLSRKMISPLVEEWRQNGTVGA